jgi:hypothetical protein
MTRGIAPAAVRWLWWIAGLSYLSVVRFQSGSQTGFVVGLGIRALSDALFASH